METSTTSDLALYARLLRQARGLRLHLAGILALSLLSVPFALLFPLPLKMVVDNVLGGRPLPGWAVSIFPFGEPASALVAALGLLLLISLLMHLQGMASWWLQTYTGERLVWDFRAGLLAHAQRLSLSFHKKAGSTDPAYRIQHDAPAIQTVLIHGIVPIITAVLTLGGMVYITARLDWTMVPVAFVVTSLLFLITRASSEAVRRRSYAIKETDSTAMGVVQEVLTSLPVVKAFGQEEREYKRFVRHSEERIQRQVRMSVTQATFSVVSGMTVALGTAAALWLGVLHVRSGRITVGELLMLMTYLAQLYAPLQLIGSKVSELQTALASMDRAFALLDEVPEITERPDARPLARAAGEVEFRDVSFRYPQQQGGLRNISIHVPAGSRVGIIGTTGAGKTTLVNLLARFYDPSRGQVLLDGVDLREFRIEDLRRQFAMVLQEPVLFSTSVAENIAYGKPAASDAEIVAAARAANADGFIQRLPKGYQTEVGERGARLSGGERQRISLARAFLRNSPILILDEPTSAVDVKTEQGIMREMENLMEGRTTFMIAHRLSTLQTCDIVLRLDRGELVDVQYRPQVIRQPLYAEEEKVVAAVQ